MNHTGPKTIFDFRRLAVALILMSGLTSTSVWATVTISGATGASGTISNGAVSTTPPTSGTTPTPTSTITTVLGGIGGPVCNNAPGTGLCDNCVQAASDPFCTNQPNCSCNTGRIEDTSVLTIQLTNTPALATGGGNAWGLLNGTSGVSGTPSGAYQPPLTQNNAGNLYDITWGTLCGAMTTSSSTGGGTGGLRHPTGGVCDNLANGSTTTLTIFIDANNNQILDNGEASVQITATIVDPGQSYNLFGNPNADGAGVFQPYPGDGQVYIINFKTTGSFPTLGYGSQAVSVRVFYSTTAMDNANYSGGEGSNQDLPIESDGSSLTNNIVTGLTNDQLYFFRIALVDQAGNVVQFFPDPANLPAACTAAGPPSLAGCPYAAEPSQVLGLLTHDINCFIATAAYGSSLEPKLDILREFRHQFLLPTERGRKFIMYYYKYGPYAARFIADKPIVRAFVRGALWPVLGFGWLAIHVGVWKAVSIYMTLMFAMISLLAYRIRSRRRRA